jgi:DNA adenine methylase
MAAVKSSKHYLKWAGGKTNIMDQILPYMSNVKGTRRVFEPFFGSGAVHRAFTSDKVGESPIEYYANDINGVLIEVHKRIASKCADFRATLREWFNIYAEAPADEKHTAKDIIGLSYETIKGLSQSAVYYFAREKYNNNDTVDAIKAALFMFLNRTCFRGLWRENSAGKMNVPFGNYSYECAVITDDILDEAAIHLKGVTLSVGDFRAFIEHWKPGANDIVYCDPPYWSPDGQIFSDYSSGGFGQKETEELLGLLEECYNRGAKIILSNTPSNLLQVWSRKFPGSIYKTIETRRRITARGTHQLEDNEVLIVISQ